jgi:hypothetical protein
MGIIFYQYTKHPSIIGLSIHEAEKKLILSGKKIKLGTKVGFIEPPQTKPYLLGKIAEQILVSQPNQEFAILNYKLYQINVDRLFSQFSTPHSNPYENQNIQPINPIHTIDQLEPIHTIDQLEPIKHNQDYQTQVNQVHERIQTDENKPIPDTPLPLQNPLQKPFKKVEKVEKVEQIKQIVPESSPVYNDVNSSFQLFPVPKAANNTRQYGNKTSYFW